MVVEISLTKNLERKKKEQIQERTNRRMLICNPTLQLVIANLYTKFEDCILNGCGDIFNENSGETEKRTNIGRTNRRRPIFNSTIQLVVVVNQYTNLKFLF